MIRAAALIAALALADPVAAQERPYTPLPSPVSATCPGGLCQPEGLVEVFGGALGLKGIEPYTNFFWVFGIAAIAIYGIGTLVNSTYGRGFLAVRDDEIAAGSMGVNAVRYKVIAFVIGAFFAGSLLIVATRERRQVSRSARPR